MSRVLFLNLLVLVAGRDLTPFSRLQVSSPMHVEVVTSSGEASLEIAADGMGLGWTVQAMVQSMTFGRTLLLGMDERAARQGFHWPAQARKATLRVPEALVDVSVTDGAQVLVDKVTGGLFADSKSNLTVVAFQTLNENRSRMFMASTGGNITVQKGYAGRAFVSVGSGSTVDLQCRVDFAEVEAEAGAKLMINADDLDVKQAPDDAVVEVINNTAEFIFNEPSDFELSSETMIP